MFKVLAIKELRESAGVVAIGLIAVAYSLLVLTGVRSLLLPFYVPAQGIPFVTDSFWSLFILITGFLAIALGLKQSAVETSRGTYYFLLHRPASRRFIFGTKLIVGVSLVLAVGALTILAYAMWAAAPGNSGAPFYWSMTAASWKTLVCVCVLYFGAFLSGLRPARWFGTRLVPLAAAAVLATIPSIFSWWWFTLAVIAASICWLVVVIFDYAEQRDY